MFYLKWKLKGIKDIEDFAQNLKPACQSILCFLDISSNYDTEGYLSFEIHTPYILPISTSLTKTPKNYQVQKQ